MLRFSTVSFIIFPVSMANAQVFETELTDALEGFGFSTTFESKAKEGDVTKFGSVEFLSEDDDWGIALDWVEENVSGDETTVTFAPNGVIFQRSDQTDTTIANLNLQDVVWQVSGTDERKTTELRATRIDAILTAIDEIATGALSFSDLKVGNDLVFGELVTNETAIAAEEITLVLTGAGSEWETIAAKLEGLDYMQSGKINQALIALIEEKPDLKTADPVLAVLNASMQGQTTAERFSLTVHGTGPDGTPIDMTTQIEGFEGTSRFSADPGVEMEMDATLEDVVFSFLSEPAQIAFDLEDYGLGFTLSLADEDVSSLITKMAVGSEPEPTDFDTIAVEAGIRVGQSDMFAKVNEGDMPGQMTISARPAFEKISVKDGAVGIEMQSEGFIGNGQFPTISEDAIQLSSNGVGMQFQMPFLPPANDSDQRMSFGINISDLVASDVLWNLFDTEALIDRGPVNIDVSIAMLGKLLEPLDEDNEDLFEIFDPSAVEIESFAITGAGVDVTANGRADMTMTDGMPVGDGSMFVTLKGVTTLVGHLVNLGIAPPEANIGVLGGLGAFTNQIKPDHYEAEVEFFPDGRITTNGRPLPIGR